MSCEVCSNTGSLPPFSIFRGDRKILFAKGVYAGVGGAPLDLTSCTEIDISLPNADGTFTHLLLSEDEVVVTSPAILGQFSALVDAEASVLLNVGELQNFDVTFTIGSQIFTVRYFQALSVFER